MEGSVACRGQSCSTNSSFFMRWLLGVKDGLSKRPYPISHIGFSHIHSVVQMQLFSIIMLSCHLKLKIYKHLSVYAMQRSQKVEECKGCVIFQVWQVDDSQVFSLSVLCCISWTTQPQHTATALGLSCKVGQICISPPSKPLRIPSEKLFFFFLVTHHGSHS